MIRKGLPLLSLIVLVVSICLAQTTPGSEQAPSRTEPIQIVADKLIANLDTNLVEFIGKVKASQGDTVIWADRIILHYRKGLTQTEQVPSSEEAVERVIAKGNVKIKMKDRTALTDTAEYDALTRVLTLSGTKSQVTDGKNSITGSKIILHRADGRITVEGSPEGRVEAFIFPGKGGLEGLK